MVSTPKIAVIGGGSWATALVKVLAENKVTLKWWIRNEEARKFIQENNHNPHYLSSVLIDQSFVFLEGDLKEAIRQSDYLLMAVPSAFLQDALKEISKEDLKGKKIISAIKGMIPERNQIIGEFFHNEFSIPFEDVIVISGPCHAEEVALEKLSYLTVASPSSENAATVSKLLRCRFMNTTPSDDIFGTEFAAVIKNIVAIASGICHALGYGDNFQAVLVSNAIGEIQRFIDAVHPINRDISDSAYLGDLLVTAYSQFSRNRTFGTMIGKGYSVRSAQLEMNMVAEGYYAAKCVHEVNKKYKIDMPICEAVYNMLYQKFPAALEIRLLTEKLH